MGQCWNCKKKIQYNKFKRYRGKILCIPCYDTRLVRKKAKKEAAKKLLDEPNLITGDNMPVSEDNDPDDEAYDAPGANPCYTKDPEQV